MTYAQGGQISYYDFTVLIGTVAGHVPDKLNTVWSEGLYDSGYGQTEIPLPSSKNQITAAQWAAAINALNNAYNHQSGVGSGISAPTAGIPISWLSTLQSRIQTSYANRLLYNSSGSSSAGAGYAFNMIGAWNQSVLGTGTRTLTWSSGDAARYFFNSGGRVGIRVDSVTNNDGTARSASIVTLGSTNFGSKTLYASTATARTGTGGIINADTTDKGYYNGLSTAPYIFTSITSTSYYSSDYILCRVSSNGVQGSLADNGNQLTLTLEVSSSAAGGFDNSNDTLNVTVNYNVFWTYPETTYLSNSWGTVTAA